MVEKKKGLPGRGEAGLWRILCRYTGVIAYNELSPIEKVGAAS